MKCIIKNKFARLLMVLAVVGLSSCGLDQYNNSDVNTLVDKNKGNEYVYGAEGDSARQLRNPDTSTPESLTRTIAIREMLYGDGEAKKAEQTPADSTAQEPAKSETDSTQAN